MYQTRYREITVPVNTTGTAGSATGTAVTEPINGDVVSVRLDFNAGAPATTTVDLDEVGGAARKILDKAASNTDVVHYPTALADDNTGTPLTGIYARFSLAGRPIRITVAASDALTPAVTVTIMVEE